MKVFVHALSGNSWVVDGQQGWTVLDVMNALEAISGVPRRDQRLVSDLEELKETDLLCKRGDRQHAGHEPTGEQDEQEMHMSLLVRNPESGKLLEEISASEFPQDLYRCASEQLRGDREVTLAVVSRHGFSLKFASSDLQDTYDVVLTAVQQTGAALAYASASMKANKEVVMAAVERHGAALEHASLDLQSDREVVLAAVSNQARALRFASEDLRADSEIVSVAACKDAGALAFVTSSKVLGDRDVMEPVVDRHPFALQYAGEELRFDWSFLLHAIEKNHSALNYAPEELRAHGEFMCLATQRNNCAKQYAAQSLRNDIADLISIQKCGTGQPADMQDLVWPCYAN